MYYSDLLEQGLDLARHGDYRINWIIEAGESAEAMFAEEPDPDFFAGEQSLAASAAAVEQKAPAFIKPASTNFV